MTTNTDSNGNYTNLTGSSSEISAGTYSVAVGCVISVYVPVAPAQISVTVSDTSYGISSTSLTVTSGSTSTTYKAFSGIISKTGSFTVAVAAIDGSGSTYTFNAVEAAEETASDLYLYTYDGLPVQVASAIRDELGQKIASNYIKSITASGRTLTLTKGNGTTSTVTTQDNNTDTKVTQSNSTTSANRPILLKNGTGTGSTTNTALFDSDVYVNPSTGTINATKYTGGTATQSGPGLMSATDKAKLDGYGVNEAATCAMRTAPTDMLNINTDSPTSSTMYESIVATEDVTTLTNCPIYSGAFYAVRKVYWMSTDGANGYTHGKVLVELHEAWPVSGRIWTRTYNRDTGSWSSWWAYRGGQITYWGPGYALNGTTIPWSQFGGNCTKDTVLRWYIEVLDTSDIAYKMNCMVSTESAQKDLTGTTYNYAVTICDVPSATNPPYRLRICWQFKESGVYVRGFTQSVTSNGNTGWTEVTTTQFNIWRITIV